MGFNYTDATFAIRATVFEVEEDGETVTVPYNGIDHAVLLSLAQRAPNDTGICWPGFGRIAEDTHFSRKSVMRSISKLALLGFISIEPPTGDRASNTYTIRMDKLVAASLLSPKPKKRNMTTAKMSKTTSFNIEDDDELV